MKVGGLMDVPTVGVGAIRVYHYSHFPQSVVSKEKIRVGYNEYNKENPQNKSHWNRFKEMLF